MRFSISHPINKDFSELAELTIIGDGKKHTIKITGGFNVKKIVNSTANDLTVDEEKVLRVIATTSSPAFLNKFRDKLHQLKNDPISIGMNVLLILSLLVSLWSSEIFNNKYQNGQSFLLKLTIRDKSSLDGFEPSLSLFVIDDIIFGTVAILDQHQKRKIVDDPNKARKKLNLDSMVEGSLARVIYDDLAAKIDSGQVKMKKYQFGEVLWSMYKFEKFINENSSLKDIVSDDFVRWLYYNIKSKKLYYAFTAARKETGKLLKANDNLTTQTLRERLIKRLNKYFIK